MVGDADLNGNVDINDFFTWNANKFTVTGKWSLADWTADGRTDINDFFEWNINKFTSSAAVAVVPEPGCGVLVLVLLGCFAWRMENQRDSYSSTA